MNNKIKCQVCNKKDAVWCYMPGHSNGIDLFCDDCVPRGCTCNQYHIDEFNKMIVIEQNYLFWDKLREHSTNRITNDTVYFEPLDEENRRYPCCEYLYDEDGFETDDDNLNNN